MAPSVIATHTVPILSSSRDDVNQAGTLGELPEQVPIIFRHVLGPFLQGLFKVASKVAGVQSGLQKGTGLVLQICVVPMQSHQRLRESVTATTNQVKEPLLKFIRA